MRGKAYCFRLIAGSIIFGIVTFGDMLYNKGNWNIYGLLWIVYGSVVFGVFFHLLFSFFMTGIKKSKDKKRIYKHWIYNVYSNCIETISG